MQSTYSGGKIRCTFNGGKDRVFEIINNSSSLVFDVVCSSSAKEEHQQLESRVGSFFQRS